MITSENERNGEFHRSSETGSYRERVAAEEFLNYKEKRVSEFAGSERPAARKSSRKKKKQKNLLISALAAVGSAAIITVAIVASLLGVTVKTRDTGYDFIRYELAIENNDGKVLIARLTNDGELIEEKTLGTDAEVSVAFENLMLHFPYRFEVADEEGKVYFSETVETRSPIRVYTRDDYPEYLFFAVDIAAFAGSGVYFPVLRDVYGETYELSVQTGWENESAIPLTDFIAGEYTLTIADAGGEVYYDVYSETIAIDGRLEAKFSYTQDNKIVFRYSETTKNRYDAIVVALRNNDGITTELPNRAVDLNALASGEYLLTAYGIKNSAKEEILSENVYVP